MAYAITLGRRSGNSEAPSKEAQTFMDRVLSKWSPALAEGWRRMFKYERPATKFR